MSQFLVYNPIFYNNENQKVETSKFQIEPTIPISFPVTEYKNADPDKEVIPVPGFTPTQVVKNPIKKKGKKTFKKESKPELESARRTLASRSENKSSNKVVWNEIWKKYGFQDLLKDDAAYLYILGQIEHESVDFKCMEEIASGEKYEGRKDLGNIQKGDGKRYKGRGPVQVTGRDNYRKIYEEFFIPNGLGEYNIVENPELGSDPRIGSMMSIGWFLVTEEGKRAIAAANNHDIKALTKAINGGLNGFTDRENRTNRLMKEAGLA